MKTIGQDTLDKLTENGDCHVNFVCRISKENADFICRQAERYGISNGQAFENLLTSNLEQDPEFAAAFSIMRIEHTIKHQTDSQKIRTMFMIAGKLMDDIIKSNQYTYEEAFDEVAENLDSIEKFIDKQKKLANEES